MIKDIIGTEGPIQMTMLVKSSARGISTSGSPYLSVIFQDKSGSIEAKMWSITENDELLCTPGQVLLVEGTVTMYRGHPQIRIEDIQPVESSHINYEKLIPTAPLSTEELKKRVYDYVDLIEDKEIKEITHHIIKEREEEYFSYPAATTVHHAFMGGLAFHSLTICSDALKIATNYPQLNKDYLISGSLLHDIGKLVELSGYIATNYTLEGNLLGHLQIGAMILNDAAKKVKINEEKLILLSHIIVSHHGKAEYGAIKPPMTLEAYVMHNLDDLDSKMEMLSSTLENVEPGEFSKKIPWMDNISFYKDKNRM